MQRARELYEEGDYTRRQFERVRTACKQDLAALTPENTPAGHEAIVILDDLSIFWETLTDEERNNLYRFLLNGVYIRGKAIAEVEPRPPFRKLLQEAAARLTEETGGEMSYEVVNVPSEPVEELINLLSRA